MMILTIAYCPLVWNHKNCICEVVDWHRIAWLQCTWPYKIEIAKYLQQNCCATNQIQKSEIIELNMNVGFIIR